MSPSSISHCCRICRAPLVTTFCDLGSTPPSNAYLESLEVTESLFPLHAYVCDNCFLVQLPQHHAPEEIFTDYAYFSSYSTSWVEHARRYAHHVVSRFHFTSESRIVEIASNDGYLLQHFQAMGLPVLGVEPAENVARVSRERGIPTLTRFFGFDTAREILHERGPAHLIVANNVFAHVPDLHDFTMGLKVLLARGGVITLEFPHLQQLMQHNQFDTIYHEHFSYFSLLSARYILSLHGLEVFDVEELPTHGGSLRLYVQEKDGPHQVTSAVAALEQQERAFGLADLQTYQAFHHKVGRLKTQLVQLLRELRLKGNKVVGYGAPAKGNTLLNYCNITSDLLPFTVDKSPHKQGKFLPGSKIPIRDVGAIFAERPSHILILPWNLRDEIMDQMRDVFSWGARFIVPIPEPTLISR